MRGNYEKPLLTRYKRINEITGSSLTLEGGTNAASCTLQRCSGAPPPIKG
jgi:hypothetical protein